MNAGVQGLLWCLAFVTLEAVQAVYFGGVLQRMDSFLIGSLVFGICAAGAIGLTLLRRPEEIALALADPTALAFANICAAGGWIAYLLAVQLVEPAVAFAVFSGSVPLTTLVAARLGMPGATSVRNRLEVAGLVIIALGLAVLIFSTLAGWSGFVRGSPSVALAGIALSIASGSLISLLLLYAGRLDRRGVGPMAQIGLRFPLYILLSVGGTALGLDAKGPVPVEDVALAVVFGLLVMALPIYAMQKAVSLVSALTIGAMTSLGPVLVFGFQMVEGRVDFARATLTGLLIYFAGALLTAAGSSKAAWRGRKAVTAAR
ncbi:MAG: hypothetical protein QNJ30_06435 [Kiloniellales bacterium]|nr:hypothetical protein [Kiloniellales bacterium]